MKAQVFAASVLITVIFPGAAAFAKVPYFAAKCPTDITVETDRAGRAYVNGTRATVRSKNANYAEIVVGGVTVSVARDSGSLIVSYTGPHRAHGICQVVEQETVENAAPESAKPESAKPESAKPESAKPESAKPGPRK